VATELRGLTLRKVDRVARGAQPGAHITLVKRRDDPVPVVEPVPVVPPEPSEVAMSKRVARAVFRKNNPGRGFPAGLSLMKESLVPADLSNLDRTALDADVLAIVDGLAADLATATKERDEARKALEAPIDPNVPLTDEQVESMAKSMDPTAAQLFKQQQTQLAAMRKQIETSEAARADLEKATRARLFKARAELLKTVGAHAAHKATVDGIERDVNGPDALAVLLDTIDAKAGSGVAEQVEDILTKANIQADALAKTLTGRPVGNDRVDHVTGAPVAKTDNLPGALAQLVKAKQDADPTLSYHQALKRSLDQRPDLYAEAEDLLRQPA